MEMKLICRLREKRAEKEITLQQVGDHLGISRGHVSLLERGLIQPNPELLLKICNLYNCQPGDLYQAIPSGKTVDNDYVYVVQ